LNDFKLNVEEYSDSRVYAGFW